MGIHLFKRVVRRALSYPLAVTVALWDATPQLERANAATADRDRYIRAFNSLEKAVTKHLDCIEGDQLRQAHKTVMRMLAERTI